MQPRTIYGIEPIRAVDLSTSCRAHQQDSRAASRIIQHLMVKIIDETSPRFSQGPNQATVILTLLPSPSVVLVGFNRS